MPSIGVYFCIQLLWHQAITQANNKQPPVYSYFYILFI